MTEAGISTTIFGTRFDPESHLPLAARAGFKSIELNLYRESHFDWREPASVRRLVDVSADLGITIWSIHSPGNGLLGLADDQERQQNIDTLRRTLDFADKLRASRVVSHGLLRGDFARDYDGTLKRMRQSVDELLTHTRNCRAMLAFENDTARTNEPWRAQDVLALVRSVNAPQRIGFALDTGHAHIAGDLGDLCAELGPELVTLHMNDNDGAGDLHQPPGEGSIDWAIVWSTLRRLDYAGCVIYEIAGHDDPREAERLLAMTMRHHRRMCSPAPSSPHATAPERNA